MQTAVVKLAETMDVTVNAFVVTTPVWQRTRKHWLRTCSLITQTVLGFALAPLLGTLFVKEWEWV